jgi:hypothetical protein
MNGIRPFTSHDIAQVADLHRDAMQTGAELTEPLLRRYREWLTTVFLENPMRTDGLESLVYEDGGEIVGFIGVVPRQVSLKRRVFRASAASNFCVRTGHRGRVGLQMAREYLARSSELALIDELTDRTRSLWDRLGMVAMPQSVRWTLPLRPIRHVLSLTARHLPRWVAAASGASSVAFDRLAARVPRSPFRYDAPTLTAQPLTSPGLARLLSEFGTDDWLRPVVADGSTEWLVERARSLKRFGDLHMNVLRDRSDKVAGWYIYQARAEGLGDVLQAVAVNTAAADQVLAHLALHARERGVINLTGTLDPVFLSALSEHWAVLSPAPMVPRWRLVFSNRPDVLEAYWRDRVLLSRLDGEWCQQLA